MVNEQAQPLASIHVGYCFYESESGCAFSNNDAVFTTSKIVSRCDVCSGPVGNNNGRFILIREDGTRGLLSVHVECAGPCEVAMAVYHDAKGRQLTNIPLA